jgi:uncharacterized protein YdeI (YjbR/CyaY-like superfamily)
MTKRAFKDREAWRAWLSANHAVKKELWLVFYKKAARRKGISYQEALEEALCYGWIDSFMRKLDDERRVIRFSPRKVKSLWSARNKATADRLIAAGRMTEFGLAKIEAAKQNGSWTKLDAIDVRLEVPQDLLDALGAKKGLREKFEALSRTRKKQYSFWVGDAKRPETRAKRIAEAVQRIAEDRHFVI